jgi:hypothetical protein
MICIISIEKKYKDFKMSKIRARFPSVITISSLLSISFLSFLQATAPKEEEGKGRPNVKALTRKFEQGALSPATPTQPKLSQATKNPGTEVTELIEEKLKERGIKQIGQGDLKSIGNLVDSTLLNVAITFRGVGSRDIDWLQIQIQQRLDDLMKAKKIKEDVAMKGFYNVQRPLREKLFSLQEKFNLVIAKDQAQAAATQGSASADNPNKGRPLPVPPTAAVKSEDERAQALQELRDNMEPLTTPFQKELFASLQKAGVTPEVAHLISSEMDMENIKTLSDADFEKGMLNFEAQKDDTIKGFKQLLGNFKETTSPEKVYAVFIETMKNSRKKQ